MNSRGIYIDDAEADLMDASDIAWDNYAIVVRPIMQKMTRHIVAIDNETLIYDAEQAISAAQKLYKSRMKRAYEVFYKATGEITAKT